MNCLNAVVDQAESGYLCIVEVDMNDRQDLVSVGLCVLVVLLQGTYLCILNLGDNQAVLASMSCAEMDTVKAIHLAEIHSLENPLE